MRVQQRKLNRVPTYRLEQMEQRMLLSAAIAGLPDGWTAHPIGLNINKPVLNKSANQPFFGSTTPIGLTPAQIVGAYGVSGISFGGVTGNGLGQTIAIVDAYNYPTAFTDLQAFDAQFGLPDPPNFEKLNQNGQPTPLPGVDPAGAGSLDGTWEEEEALDIEWAHAIAPEANIILFEANNDGQALYTADLSAARTPGVSVISNSWGGDEFSDETASDATFDTPVNHQGVTFVFAAGDSGAFDPGTTTFAPNYPASSPNVVSVGGTTLNVSGTTYGSESAWGDGDQSGIDDNGGGGGISAYEPEPQYQKFLVSQSTTNRTYPDVAMEADPATGVPVYDSYDNGTAAPWFDSQVGGTSLATPMFSALIAIANQGRVLTGATTLDGVTQTVPRLYTLPEADFHDVDTGSNGYDAGTGYDLATGRGSPVANLLVPDLASNYIGFHAFNDTNLDGYQDNSETGVAGVTVSLYTVGADGVIGTSDDVLTATTTTDAYGLYDFTNIAVGTYYVHFVFPTGYTITPDTGAGAATTNSLVDPGTGNTGAIIVGLNTEYNLANAGAYHQTISIDDVTINRPHSGLAQMVFTVTLSPMNVTTTAVSYTTVDGTATVAHNDYQATSGTLLFAAGVTEENIIVEAVGNLTIENTVEFTVNTTIPTGFYPLKTVGVGTIVNTNFPLVTVSTPAAQTRSSTTTLNYPFVVSLSAAAPFEVDVPYTTTDMTAVGGVDFIAITGTLIFPANSTTSQTVDVTVFSGTNRQLDKKFGLTLSASASVTLGTPSMATATILTNAPPGINANPAEVTESLTGIAYLPFTVDVAPSLTGPVTVNYATSDGTAIAGKDYQSMSGTLTFAPGRIVQTVFVPVYQQFIPQQDKTVIFTLSNASGSVVLVSPVVTGTIHYLSLAALPFSAAKKVTYIDSLNQRVTVSVKGAGTGNIIFLGSASSATNAYEISVTGTNTASSVSIKVAGGGQTTLTDLVVSSPLGTLDAKTTNLTSLLNASDSIGVLNLGYTAGATLNIGGAGSGQTAALTFNRAVNTTINSAIAIRTLTAGAYLNTTGSALYITAPSVGTVKVKGNFGGTIRSSSVASLLVGGIIDSGGILAGGNIGTVQAASITNSTFYAGVNGNVTTLPATLADFANTTSLIKSVRVKGGLFSNTQISSWNVQSVSSSAANSTGGTVSISGNSIGKVKTAAVTHKIVQVTNPTTDTSVGNVTMDLI